MRERHLLVDDGRVDTRGIRGFMMELLQLSSSNTRTSRMINEKKEGSHRPRVV